MDPSYILLGKDEFINIAQTAIEFNNDILRHDLLVIYSISYINIRVERRVCDGRIEVDDVRRLRRVQRMQI